MKILFLCTGNSCRSQMAEGYARLFGQGTWEIKSAGTAPQGINPRAIIVMKEDGVDISTQKSTLLTKEMLKWADLVITLCGDANDRCSILPKGVEKRHWPIEDPAKTKGTENEILAQFKNARNDIKARIETLKKELTVQNKPQLRARL